MKQLVCLLNELFLIAKQSFQIIRALLQVHLLLGVDLVDPQVHVHPVLQIRLAHYQEPLDIIVHLE